MADDRMAGVDGGAVEFAFQAGEDSQPIKRDEIGRGYLVAVLRGDAGEQRLQVEDLERFLAAPRRKKGAAAFRETASFVEYVNRFQEDGTVLTATPEGKIDAVLNYHAGVAGAAGWADHHATLVPDPDPSWTAWNNARTGSMNQAQLADFLEDRLGDIGKPAGADLVEIAKSFSATKKITFQSAQRLDTGAIDFVYREDVDGNSGKQGKITVPQDFTILVTPFRDTRPAVTAVALKLRWRLDEGKVAFTFRFPEAWEDIRRAAVDQICDRVEDATKRMVWRGTVRAG